MSALNTDLYELTMAAGYFTAGKTKEVATFELSARKLPENRNFLVAAGLQQAVEYLSDLRFHGRRDRLPAFPCCVQARSPRVLQIPSRSALHRRPVRITGRHSGVSRTNPSPSFGPLSWRRSWSKLICFPRLRFQTMVASKAIRCVTAAQDRPVVEFGSRRAHSPEAGILAGRAAYIAGCSGTSNSQAGKNFGIPVFGTAAHSWTMSFPTEEESFRALQKLLGECDRLPDRYLRHDRRRTSGSTKLGPPCWGLRLDSGDIVAQSREVRRILDEAGMQTAKIFATNDLNEYRLAELVRAGAPIDAFGVGTQLATSADAPTLSVVYKLVELRKDKAVHYAAKFSDEKSTLPGAKQIYRYPDHDVVALASECNSDFSGGEPLIRPIFVGRQAGRIAAGGPSDKSLCAHRDRFFAQAAPVARGINTVHG